MNNTDAVEYEFQQQMEHQKKAQQLRAAQWARLDNQTTTVHTRIPNMKNAYAEVVAKKYQPTQQEIEYRRFTSGGFLDNAKGK